ncbi:MAG: YbjN domain-containing protein [Pasteurellaceae bacterium]|nr:YbjN domain-containing protein [Pasteurellaceae bacterium]
MSSSYEEVFDEFTDRQLVSILEGEDYDNVRILKSGFIRFSKDSMNYILNNSYSDGSLGIFMMFDDFDMSYKEMNEWNKEKRFVKIYKNDDGNICLGMDLESGMTEEYLIKSINRFISLQTLFSLSRLGELSKFLNLFK